MVSRYIEPVPTQESYQQQLVNMLRARLPGWTPDITDPGYYWADDTSGEIIKLINQFNASADANFILTATGTALDELLRQFGIINIDPNLSDAEKRLIFQRRWDSITQGTPAWDIRRALEAAVEQDIMNADVGRSAVDWHRNLVYIYILDSMGQNLQSDLRVQIQDRLNAPDKPTFWIDYRVRAATTEDYLVSGEIVYNSSLANPIAEVRSNLDAALLSLKRLNTGIDDSTIISQIWEPSVRRVELTLTKATLNADGVYVPGANVGAVKSITVTDEGSGWGNIPPTINIVGGGGTGAVATAVLNNAGDRLASIFLTNGGRGYTSAPKIEIVGNGRDAVAVAEIEPEMSGEPNIVRTGHVGASVTLPPARERFIRSAWSPSNIILPELQQLSIRWDDVVIHNAVTTHTDIYLWIGVVGAPGDYSNPVLNIAGTSVEFRQYDSRTWVSVDPTPISNNEIHLGGTFTADRSWPVITATTEWN